MTKDAIKQELKIWGTELKNDALDYFQKQGLDLIAILGDAYLDKLIRWAADRVSPFPGKETAAALLEDELSNRLIKWGVDYTRKHWLTVEEDVE